MELNELLNELGAFSYSCFGIPAFMLYCHEGEWSCCYRNACEFKNPIIKADSPLEACRQMQVFLKGLTNGTTETKR